MADKRLGNMNDGDQHMSLSQQNGDERQQVSSTNPNALPTPASLPRKKQVPNREVEAAARVLFPTQPETLGEAMPTSRKNRKSRRQVGFSLYDDGRASSEEKVQVYTDSRDKVPEAGPHEDNPFLGRDQPDPPPAGPATGRPSRKRKEPHVNPNPQIEQVFNRDEGMVYVLYDQVKFNFDGIANFRQPWSQDLSQIS